MIPRILILSLLVACTVLTGCDGGFERAIGLATPTPTPTPPVAAPETPKPGAWMWEKRGRTLLDSTPRRR
jgi:hypothetical protein